MYGEFDGADPFPDWFERLQSVAAREADDSDEVLREQFTNLTEDAEEVFL
mgnify:CR=1 FL=1